MSRRNNYGLADMMSRAGQGPACASLASLTVREISRLRSLMCVSLHSGTNAQWQDRKDGEKSRYETSARLTLCVSGAHDLFNGIEQTV